MGAFTERTGRILALDLPRISSVSFKFDLSRIHSDTRISYFLKYERYNPSHQYPGVDPTLRGVRGLIDSKFYCLLPVITIRPDNASVGYHTHFSNPSLKFIEACKAAGVAHSHDVNTHQGTLGVTKVCIVSYRMFLCIHAACFSEQCV